MRWPWKRAEHHAELHELHRARERLDEVRRQWPVVIAVSQALRGHQERNHFADSLASIFRGGEEK